MRHWNNSGYKYGKPQTAAERKMWHVSQRQTLPPFSEITLSKKWGGWLKVEVTGGQWNGSVVYCGQSYADAMLAWDIAIRRIRAWESGAYYFEF